MQLTEQMLREAYQQTQREILENGGSNERYKARWERMAEILNEKLSNEEEEAKENAARHAAIFTMIEEGTLHFHS
jgi:hypothetical protein